MKKVLGVIPARYSDSHLPGKVLKKIGERTIIEWVYESAQRCPEIDKLVITTDDERVREVAEKIGAEHLVTRQTHKTGTDRLVEVAEYYSDYDCIVNIQGNMPGIDPGIISGVVNLKKENSDLEMSTAARPFLESEDPQMPNHVKVVVSKNSKALYFSRSLIPFSRQPDLHPVYLHLGVYALSRDFLFHFATLPPSGLEKAELLEQLRVLENDYRIGVFLTNGFGCGVDTESDFNKLTEYYNLNRGFFNV